MQVNEIDFSIGEEMNFLATHKTTEVDNSDVMNTQDVYNLRLETCMKCQHVTQERMCTECGCPVVMMAQMNFKMCPKGYW